MLPGIEKLVAPLFGATHRKRLYYDNVDDFGRIKLRFSVLGGPENRTPNDQRTLTDF